MPLFGSLTVSRDLHRLQAESAQLSHDVTQLLLRVDQLEREKLHRELELHDLRTKYLNAVKRISMRVDRANSPAETSEPLEESEPYHPDVLSLRRQLGK